MDSGITVTGTGQAHAPADLLHLRLGVGHDAADVAAAVSAVARRTDAVTAALRDHGVAQADIRTSAVSVFPQYADSMQVAGYRAAHTLDVETADLTGFGRLLKAAIDAAGNDLAVEQLSFDVSDKTALLVVARQAAFEQARDKATELAGLVGRALGTVRAVEESLGGHYPVSRSAKTDVALAAELAVTPGEQAIEASLTVHWEWA
jgi:uncharacterized protein YggE